MSDYISYGSNEFQITYNVRHVHDLSYGPFGVIELNKYIQWFPWFITCVKQSNMHAVTHTRTSFPIQYTQSSVTVLSVLGSMPRMRIQFVTFAHDVKQRAGVK